MSKRLQYLFWIEKLGPYDSQLKLLLQKISETPNLSEREMVVREHYKLFLESEKNLSSLQSGENKETEQNTETQTQQIQCRLRYKSYLLVLLDLLRQSWTLECQDEKLFLTPPYWEEGVRDKNAAHIQKAAIRESLDYERRAQLQKPSVHEFIRFMERDHNFNGSNISIKSLFADGNQMASELAVVASLEEDAQYEAVCKVIQPYLQLVASDVRCEQTGFSLNDIWRYMRYTWSIPYNSTPGRNMFYLVRDAARPYHPIIGIGALGSSMVQLTERDDIIGWTFKAIRQRIQRTEFTSEEVAVIVQTMLLTIREALDDLATDDLISDEELRLPTEETLSRLRKIVDASREKREKILKQRQICFLQKKIAEE